MRHFLRTKTGVRTYLARKFCNKGAIFALNINIVRNNVKNKKTKQKKAVRIKMTVARCAAKLKATLCKMHKFIRLGSVKFTVMTK